MYGYIYKTTNLINGKIYIGQHKATTFNPSYKGSGFKIINAFKHYGKDNFKVELLDIANDSNELNQKEKKWIHEFKAQDEKIGYNLAEGGRVTKVFGSRNASSRPEVREKISKAVKEYARTHHDLIVERGKKGARYGKKMSEEAKEKCRQARLKYIKEHPDKIKCGHRFTEEQKKKISESLKKYYEKQEKATGYKHTEKARKKMSEKAKGRIPWNKNKKYKVGKRTGDSLKHIQEANKKNNKKIICITTNTVYESINQASEKTGVKAVTISSICISKATKTKSGLVFRFYDE